MVEASLALSAAAGALIGRGGRRRISNACLRWSEVAGDTQCLQDVLETEQRLLCV